MSDAELLAHYADALMRRAKEALARKAAAEVEAAALVLRAKIAIREAKAQLPN